MKNGLERKFGLLTAICMVVGIVIGSGVFFKAEKILAATGGNLPIGILAWLVGGLIMVVSAYTFAVMATKFEKVNGVVDYAESLVGPKYGYFVGWFMATIYYPSLTCVLAWVTARYTCVLLGWENIVGPEAMVLTLFYLVASFAINTLSPIIAGKFQVATTIIKLIPLFLMAIVGTIVGLKNGILVENFTTVAQTGGGAGAPKTPFLVALVATAFAYEGWIIATSINAELKDAKKNLPKALVVGTLLIVFTYICYYVGLAGAVPNEVLMNNGENGVKTAFQEIFSHMAGTGIFVLIIISCMGTLNGLMLACTRGFYSLAVRNEGPKPEVLKQVAPITNMAVQSAVVGLLFAAIWFVYFFGANLTTPWFGKFVFDPSELPIVTVYAMYIPIYLNLMKKGNDLNVFKRIIMPILAICGAVFMIFAAFYSHRMGVFYYGIVFVVVMVIGLFVKGGGSKGTDGDTVS